MARIIEKKFENIPMLAEIILSGSVGALPCDTIYGISARVSRESEERIFTIKKRSASKSLICLMSIEDLRGSELDVPLVLYDIYPAPLTAILKGKDGLTHAVRVPSDDFVLSLLSLTGPLFSTSVNISGKKSLLTFDDVFSSFSESLDFIVKADIKEEGTASTIVDMSARPYKVIRMGSYNPERILSI